MAGPIASAAMSTSYSSLTWIYKLLATFCKPSKRGSVLSNSKESTESHERIAVSIGLCLVTPDSFLTDREVQERQIGPMQHAKQVSKNCIGNLQGRILRRRGSLRYESSGTEGTLNGLTHTCS